MATILSPLREICDKFFKGFLQIKGKGEFDMDKDMAIESVYLSFKLKTVVIIMRIKGVNYSKFWGCFS